MAFPLKNTRRLPAEWESHDATLLAWPHQQTDWEPILSSVTELYIELIAQITRFEPVVIIAPEPQTVHSILQQTSIDLSLVTVYQIETNDTWIRDYGPLITYEENIPQLHDFIFNGWGGKFPAHKDNLTTQKLHRTNPFKGLKRYSHDLILEGGSIESDGAGTLLTTSKCLLNANRNPHLSKSDLESKLSELLGFNHFLWLDHGWLSGDDTDSHIDTLARLCPDNTIVYVECPDSNDEHYAELQKMKSQLESFKTKGGQPFRLVPLPWPSPCYDEAQRLPASYANFLILNQAILVPTYRGLADKQALATIGDAFPQHQIIGIDCSPLIKQHGSLHCITMQLPQGVLR